MNSLLLPAKVKFLLVRAGSTDLDDQGRILGSLNLPLSNSGVIEAGNTANELNGLKIDAIYSSVCEAAQQTAARISCQGKIKVRVAEKLTNLSCGLWHGKSIAELRETQPTLFKQWKENPEAVRPPQGETVADVRERAAALLSKIRRKFKTGLVVIVAPNPLLSIIRCEVDLKPLVGKNDRTTKCGSWELVEQLGQGV